MTCLLYVFFWLCHCTLVYKRSTFCNQFKLMNDTVKQKFKKTLPEKSDRPTQNFKFPTWGQHNKQKLWPNSSASYITHLIHTIHFYNSNLHFFCIIPWYLPTIYMHKCETISVAFICLLSFIFIIVNWYAALRHVRYVCRFFRKILSQRACSARFRCIFTINV